MIDLLLSDRADERRSLFEEAAGIGLYRDRKHSTERRLEETATDLQRVEDLIAEVQSQIRSLARQRGKAERHAKLTEEKFAVQVTLARRLLERLSQEAAGMESRFGELSRLLPTARQRLSESEQRREDAARTRAAAETQRTDVERRLGAVRVELGKLDGDLALAAERLANASTRRQRAQEERTQMEVRAQLAVGERDSAAADRDAAAVEHDRIRGELAGRAEAEEDVRRRLGEQRAQVRALGAGAADAWPRRCDRSRASARRSKASWPPSGSEPPARPHIGPDSRPSWRDAERRRDHAVERAGFLSHEAKRASADAERARHLVAEAREQEAMHRSDRRRAEEALAQMTARRHALEELERDRVGLAPAAAALLAARERFDGGVLGPLSDFVSTGREDAELAERLLGDWMHAVLVRDRETVRAIQAWHAEQQPGALVLLPLDPGPASVADGQPLDERLRAEGPAAGWVRAALCRIGGAGRRRAGCSAGRAARSSCPARRRPRVRSGAVPSSRRSRHDVERGEVAVADAESALQATTSRLAEREQNLGLATAAAEQAREAERQSAAAREDAIRVASNLAREMAESEAQLARVTERLTRAEQRLAEIDEALTDGDLTRGRLEESLGGGRGRLAELEAEQEAAREQRVHWQVQEAHVAGGLRSAEERLQRAATMRDEAERAVPALSGELTQLESDTVRVGRTAGGMAREPRRAPGGAPGARSREQRRRSRRWPTPKRASCCAERRGERGSRTRSMRRARRVTRSRSGSPRRPVRGAASSSGSRRSGGAPTISWSSRRPCSTSIWRRWKRRRRGSSARWRRSAR